MTNCYGEREGGHCLLRLEGHATGKPEVCAAISGLVYSLAGYLSNTETEIYRMDLEPGDVTLHFNGGEREIGAFEMTVIGLRQLERQYPEQVKTKIWRE